MGIKMTELDLKAEELLRYNLYCTVPSELMEAVEKGEDFISSMYCVLEDDLDDDAMNNYKDPLCYYLVSSYLGKMLKRINQPVFELSNSTYIWGRCTSGQSILLDGTIQKAMLNAN
jgi:hypothetical protein